MEGRMPKIKGSRKKEEKGGHRMEKTTLEVRFTKDLGNGSGKRADN